MPALRLSLLATALALIAVPSVHAERLTPHATAALKGTSMAVPVEGQVAVKVNAAPGAQSCRADTSAPSFQCTVFAPVASAFGHDPVDLLDTVKPACRNGRDDGDGLIDSRAVAGATDPDPGCTDPTDTIEESEQPLPAPRRSAGRRPWR